MRQVERLFVYAGLLLLGAALWSRRPAVAEGPSDQDVGVLTVREIRLVTSDGQVAARLGADADGAGFLRLSGPGGKSVAVTLEGNETGGHLALANTAGKTVVEAAPGPDGHGSVTCTRAEGADHVQLGCDADACYVGFRDDAGVVRGGLVMMKDRATALVLRSPTGEGNATFGWDEDGAYVKLPDHDGTTGYFAGLGPAGGLSYAVNKAGKQVVWMGAAEDNHAGVISVSSADGVGAAQVGRDADGGYVALRDPAGERRALLALVEAGGMLGLTNKEGEDAVWLGTASSSHAGLFSLYGPKGQRFLEASLGSDGPALYLENEGGDSLVYLGAASGDGHGMIALARKDGTRYGAISHPSAGGAFSLQNASGETCCYLGASSDRDGYLYLTDPQGRKAVELATSSAGGGYLSLDMAGRAIGYLGTSTAGTGLFKLYQGDGGVALEAGVQDSAGYVSLWNAIDNLTASLFAADGSRRGGGLSLKRGNGGNAIMLGVRPEGVGGIDFFDASGNLTQARDR